MDRGEELVAKLSIADECAVPAPVRLCELDVTFTSDTIDLDLRRDRRLVPIVDSGDAVYPLESMKPTSNGYWWKGAAK